MSQLNSTIALEWTLYTRAFVLSKERGHTCGSTAISRISPASQPHQGGVKPSVSEASLARPRVQAYQAYGPMIRLSIFAFIDGLHRLRKIHLSLTLTVRSSQVAICQIIHRCSAELTTLSKGSSRRVCHYLHQPWGVIDAQRKFFCLNISN
jgi:hypothetical protein